VGLNERCASSSFSFKYCSALALSMMPSLPAVRAASPFSLAAADLNPPVKPVSGLTSGTVW